MFRGRKMSQTPTCERFPEMLAKRFGSERGQGERTLAVEAAGKDRAENNFIRKLLSLWERAG